MVNPEEKKEVQALIEAFDRSSMRRRSRLFFLLKIGTGYAAMVIFTVIAITFSALNLSAINKTAREITYTDLPAVSTLIKLRSSLMAQERFAGKYAILRDRAFVELFRQREKEFLANLRILQQTGAVQEHGELNGLYVRYQAATQRLFSGDTENPDEHRASATQLFKAINDFNAKRQAKLHAVIQRADHQRRSTIGWTIAISCAGFLLTVWIVPFVTSRIFGATRKLQMATHRALAGDFSYHPEMEAYEEIGDLADDVTTLTEKLTELERLNFAAKRHAEDATTARILEEELKQGKPFAICEARVDELGFVTAQHGYAKATQLLRLTAYLLQSAAREYESSGFVGHVGGDSFIMILPPDKVEAVCAAAIASFDAEVRRLFDTGEADAEEAGAERPIPVTTIAITTLICGAGQGTSAADITCALDTVRGKTAGKRAESRWKTVAWPFLSILLAACLVSGCAILPGGEWVTGSSRGSAGEGDDAAADAPSRKEIMSKRLTQAVQTLRSGDVPDAKRKLRAICSSKPVPGVTDEALFRLALLSLKPSSDTPAAERGQLLLRRLKKEYPKSNWNIQAEPLRELIDVAEELKSRNRSLANSHEALTSEVSELTKKLKQLKHLDIELEHGSGR